MNKNLEKILNFSKEKVISILPHDNADVDAILSSYLFSKLLDFLNIPNEILIFDKSIGKDTLYILNLLNIDIKPYMINDELDIRNLFLLDHYKTAHSGKVIGCIDHHPNSENLDYSIYDCRITCATAYTIYQYMLEINMNIDKKIVECVVYSMMIDTCGFRNSKTVENEVMSELPKMIEEYGLDYENMLNISSFYTDIKSMNIDEIVTNGIKAYNFKKGKVKASYIQIKKYEEIDGVFCEIISNIRKRIADESLLVWVYIIYALDSNMTYIKYVYSNSICSSRYYKILSRGNDVMPDLEKLYN